MNDTQKIYDPIDEMGNALHDLELAIANRLGSLEAENDKLRAENAKLRDVAVQASKLRFAQRSYMAFKEHGDDYDTATRESLGRDVGRAAAGLDDALQALEG